ncbi:methyl-accepting chemotaxis protein [Clostridium sp. 'White wine YQ']|uniref:methyl-accepting chemotaxis protein n=1 Tax=Clostridium sp. 'White wine YQ' TaxID=3027474 RepID=UPI002365C5B7|nr:methyl-accepting chemotaxis protein [Clostridium sp. 'White wine YQ']MDD7795283.1 methyl-accepting chemotaxis protein [Clostridium sp. 'White wine YQ']
MKLRFNYLLNRSLKSHSEMVFEGISKGRKKALENWFRDKWVQLETTMNTIKSLDEDSKEINLELEDKLKYYSDFSELLVINEAGKVVISTCQKHIGDDMSIFPNFEEGIRGNQLMYGPYNDEKTLDLNLSNKKFFDEVTLLFSIPYRNENNERRILCTRVLNDDMSNVIQDEDTHIYKDSGDNYLFMIKSDRNILPGTAISRSRFEDNTFTMGENLKDGVKTSKWGVVKINKHTEFEVIFNDPATGKLHPGIQKTMENEENLDCWPGYPDYRHIMVGGKGTIIRPPYSNEVWGMMCEGDIAEIYNFRSVNLRIPLVTSIITALFLIVSRVLTTKVGNFGVISDIATWIIITLATYFISKKIVVKPLNTTVSILHMIAEGEGDLTKRVDKLSSDEIGELSRWFNKFINNQMNMVKRVGTSAKTTKKSIKAVSELTENIKNSMKVIAGTVESLLSNTNNQNELIQNSKAQFNDISTSIKEMDELINQVTEKAIKTSKYAVEANGSSEEVLNSMEELDRIMERTLKSIDMLQKRSNEISQVISVISRISKQTQLLSLNATIEAARAGEAGKGFSIVAQEISKLASETEESTTSISEIVRNIQLETKNTSGAIEHINSSVKKSVISTKEAIKSFGLISNNITEVTKTMESISKITNSQSISVNKVDIEINKMAEVIRKNTLQGASSSEESLSLVEDILRQIIQLKQVSEIMVYSSDNLEEIVGGFKIV